MSKTKPHVARSTGNNEWYTPSEYIEAARAVMGCIDTDPASSEFANRTIQAKTYYTAETDGLTKEWHGQTWMNPPYSSDRIGLFCDKLIAEIDAGHVTEAITLINNATDTRWFDVLSNRAAAIVFPVGRIRFYGPDGEKDRPLQGQAIMYFGEFRGNFAREFSKFGKVWYKSAML